MAVKNVSLENVGNILKTPFMTPKSKELIKAGWAGKIDDFAKKLSEYTWPHTRDYTLAVIMLTVVVAASKANNIMISAKQRGTYGFKKSDMPLEKMPLSEYVNKKVSNSKIKELFENIVNIEKTSDSSNIANYISKDDAPHGWFTKCFGSFVAQYNSSGRVFTEFLKQVKKMTPWKINKSYMRELTDVIGNLLGQQIKTTDVPNKKGGTPLGKTSSAPVGKRDQKFDPNEPKHEEEYFTFLKSNEDLKKYENTDCIAYVGLGMTHEHSVMSPIAVRKTKENDMEALLMSCRLSDYTANPEEPKESIEKRLEVVNKFINYLNQSPLSLAHIPFSKVPQKVKFPTNVQIGDNPVEFLNTVRQHLINRLGELNKPQPPKIDTPMVKKSDNLISYLYNKSNDFMPSPNDIDQSGRGANNCYMLGVLVSMAERNPKFIKDTLIKTNGNEIIVTLWDYKLNVDELDGSEKKELYQVKEICTPTTKHEYKLSCSDIDNFIHKYISWNEHKAKWVFAVEIAFAKLLKECHPDVFKSYMSLHDVLGETGVTTKATVILTGKTAKRNVMREYANRKKENKNFPKKFPENAKYDDYCLKILRKMRKHLETEKTSGYMVASFEGIKSSYISKKKLLAILKSNPNLLLQPKIYSKLVYGDLKTLPYEFFDMIEGKRKFIDSEVCDNIIQHCMAPYLDAHIDEPAFEEFKKFKLGHNKSRFWRWGSLTSKKDGEQLLMNNANGWREKLLAYASDPQHREGIEILLNTIKEPDFTKSAYFEYELKETVVPYLADKLDDWDWGETARKMGLKESHAYAVLNCFQDQNPDPSKQYWYVTLQNTMNVSTKINYEKSKRLTTLKFPPDPKQGVKNAFNMELADFCKYLRSLSYDRDGKKSK